MADFIGIGDDHALETVGVYTSPWEAHIARGRLEAEGIAAFVIHENHIWAAWVLSNALGGVKLQVATEEAERARQILERDNQGEFEADLEVLQEDSEAVTQRCPRCHSDQLRHRFSGPSLLLVAVTLGVMGVIFPLRRERHVCARCGHEWRY